MANSYELRMTKEWLEEESQKENKTLEEKYSVIAELSKYILEIHLDNFRALPFSSFFITEESVEELREVMNKLCRDLNNGPLKLLKKNNKK